MAVIESWFTQERTQPVKVRYLDGNVFSMDNNGNLIGIEVLENGEPASISGSVSASVVRADGATIAVTGAKDGNKCSVILPQACYAVPGVISIVIKLTSGSDVSTIGAIVGNVYQSSTDTVVDPGEIIPSISALIEEIEEAVASIPADYSALWTSLAPAFSTSKTYPIGEYCTYNGKLYRFTTAHPAGSWDSSHVVVTNIGAELNWLLTERVPHFPNIGYAAFGALLFAYDSANSVYTITASANFTLYGFSTFKNLVSIGYGGNQDYPMPSSFSGTVSASTFAVICYDRTDNTTDTWKIVPLASFVGNRNLMAIAVAYKDRVFFFDDNLKVMFKNTITTDVFLNYNNNIVRAIAPYYSYLCNATALITGSVNYIPSEYKIVITRPIIGPNIHVGGFNAAKESETITLDWSQEVNPGYVRFIYFDNITDQFVAICANNLTDEERAANRRNKAAMALICAVYQGTFVYTCGACTPGKWFVNGNDIYGGASSEFPPDLFKTFRRVGVIGDSLSVGYMMNKETGVVTSRMLAYSWPKRCMADAGGVPWLNLGTSGQSVLTWCSNATYGKVQAEAANNLCQAYIIGLGENDQSNSSRGIPLGEPADIVDDYTHVASTYYGGYARIIQILKHLNPDCKIFCLTNPRTGTGRAAYNVAVRYIAGTYYTPDDNVFLVDLANDDPSLFNGGTFLPVDAATITGGHYSAVGYARIASIMEKAITKAIEANQTHFIDVAYIPYATGDPTPNTMTE